MRSQRRAVFIPSAVSGGHVGAGEFIGKISLSGIIYKTLEKVAETISAVTPCPDCKVTAPLGHVHTVDFDAELDADSA